jgi:hypothetical protein
MDVVGRLRICDDATARLLLRVSERRRQGGRVVARARLLRWLKGPPAGGCKRYTRRWHVVGKLAGRRGRFVVGLRVRDAQGAWSAPARPRLTS